ncbi:MAG: GTPase HflX [Kiritimatiellae bacterium]|nr:GTPase HflX [Kiritimatiellia bacterium]
MKEKTTGWATTPPGERCLLLSVIRNKDDEWPANDSLQELARLVHALGGTVVQQQVLKQRAVQSSHYIGKGTAEILAGVIQEQQCDCVIFDDEMTPAQGRNLEAAFNCRVVDRTQVILDIFARHAKTREGILQIELALLNYQLPRLRRLWTHLERQTGGIGIRGGPGEKQMEVDRRRIKERITRIQKDLKDVRRHRQELRRGRKRHGWATAYLIGYTNAGKSTLLNALTEADVEVKDALFVTLDTTVRKVELPNQLPALISDTVGFINKLPHHLIEAFRATLEEVMEADVLVHVVDASCEQVEEQISAVHRVLDELGIGDRQTIMAMNKMDTPMGAMQAERLSKMHRLAVPISAKTGEGLPNLLALLADQLRSSFRERYLRIPFAEAQKQAAIHTHGTVLEQGTGPSGILMHVRMQEAMSGRYAAYEITQTVYDEEKSKVDGEYNA